MSNRQLEQIIDGIAAAYDAERQRNRSFIDAAVEQFREELRSGKTNLQIQAEVMLAQIQEQKLALKDGEPGKSGPAGEPGMQGEVGPPGERGETGEKGEPGECGEKGDKGEPGDKGERGESGPAGETIKGDKGDPGQPGPGADAILETVKDALRAERLDLNESLFAATRRFDEGIKKFERLSEAVEERLLTLKDGEQGPPGEPGEPGRDGIDGAPGRDGITGEARGKYDPAALYNKFDRVSFNGSEWIARRDLPGNLPGDGWMLGAMGKKGRPGVGIQAVSMRDYAFLLEMSDGKTLTVDLRAMFERYHEERSAE